MQAGLIPVFPPQEDIQVGDVFAISFGDEVTDFFFEQIGSEPQVLALSQAYMRDRLVFQKTTTANSAIALAQEDLYGASFRKRGELATETLPIAAFPKITADAGTTFGIGYADPLVGLGLGIGRRTTVTLDFGDVRSYGLPRVVMARQGLDPRSLTFGHYVSGNAPTANTPLVVEDALNRQARLALGAGKRATPPDQRCTEVFVVTRVFMTRTIHYTFSDAKIRALAAEYAAGGATALDAPNVPQVSVTLNEGVVSPTQLPTDSTTLASAVSPASVGTGEASGLTFQGFTAFGASFTETFNRPVVIGWEGWSYQVIQRPGTDTPRTVKETRKCALRIQ